MININVLICSALALGYSLQMKNGKRYNDNYISKLLFDNIRKKRLASCFQTLQTTPAVKYKNKQPTSLKLFLNFMCPYAD